MWTQGPEWTYVLWDQRVAPCTLLRAWARALLRAPLGPLKGLGTGPLKGPPGPS